MYSLHAFDPVRDIQKSQNFICLDEASVKEVDFDRFTPFPNQFLYKINCHEAEITDTKGNTASIFKRESVSSIDHIYEMIKPGQVERFIEETKTNFRFIMAEPKRSIPSRNMFSSIFELKVGSSYKPFLRQIFSLRSDKQGIITHTGGMYTVLPSRAKSISSTYQIYGKDAVYFKNEHLAHFRDIVSKRELQILKYLSEGYKATAIGQKLFISKLTVETHRKNIIKKLEAKNTAHLISLSKDIGLI